MLVHDQARLWACGRGDVSTPSFGSHLNPISTRGADYAHPILVSTPSFESHRRACYVVTVKSTVDIFLMVLTNQLIYLVNVKTMRKIFFKLCVLLKKSEV